MFYLYWIFIFLKNFHDYEKINVRIQILKHHKLNLEKLNREKPLNSPVCSYHVTYAFQSESTLHSCLNVKEILARSRREIWSLSDCNWTRTHSHLVHKRTRNYLTKLNKWLSCVVSTYLYGAFDCMYLSCHVRVSEWIHTP